MGTQPLHESRPDVVDHTQLQASLTLSRSRVHIWCVALDRQNPEPATSLLSRDERERAERFHFPRDRRRFESARSALRVILSRYLGAPAGDLRFEYSPHGKPALAPPADLTFNLSHSGEMALVAVARGRAVGVDIERVRDADISALAHAAFSDREQAALGTIPSEKQLEAFFRGWVRKEAYIKARSEGLALHIEQIEVSLERAPALLSTPHSPDDVLRFVLHDLDVAPGYLAAMAVEHGFELLEYFEYV